MDETALLFIKFLVLDKDSLCTDVPPPSGKIWRVEAPGGGGYSHTLPIRVCAAQRDRDFSVLFIQK